MEKPKTKLRLKMNTPNEVRRTLVRISNMVVNEEIGTSQANTIILACNAVLNSIRTDAQQRQIKELAEMLDQVTSLGDSQ